MADRVILHSDLNNCYASIECMLHPELKGKYIAVCGSTDRVQNAVAHVPVRRKQNGKILLLYCAVQYGKQSDR